MNENRSISKNRETQFIKINTHNCKACWKCIANCPQNVIGKINIIIHKHAVIKNVISVLVV